MRSRRPRSIRLLVAAVLSPALVIAGCGEDEGAATDATVAEIAESPQSFNRRVAVTGIGSPVGEIGFVLEAGGDAIFVSASSSEALKVDDGDDLQVVGAVRPLEDFQSEAIAEATGSDVAEVDQEAIDETPTAPGDPYLELVSLSGEDTPSPSEPPG